MNRRDILKLSLLASLPNATQARAEDVAVSMKKGLGLTIKSPGWNRKLADLRCKWFYSWGAAVPDGIPAGTSFAPMIWGYWGNKESIAKDGASIKAAGIKELLGFNEPDQIKQANLSVEKVLDLWPLLMETGLRLGSPGCVHPDREWMKSFMEGAKKRHLRVDFVCVHSYGGPSADALVKRLTEIHKLYGKPIWITEFAVGDWEAKSPAQNRHSPATVLKFMEAVLPRLEKLDFVERYAWFPAGQEDAALCTSALFDKAGKITRLGECYRDLA